MGGELGRHFTPPIQGIELQHASDKSPQSPNPVDQLGQAFSEVFYQPVRALRETLFLLGNASNAFQEVDAIIHLLEGIIAAPQNYHYVSEHKFQSKFPDERELRIQPQNHRHQPEGFTQQALLLTWYTSDPLGKRSLIVQPMHIISHHRRTDFETPEGGIKLVRFLGEMRRGSGVSKNYRYVLNGGAETYNRRERMEGVDAEGFDRLIDALSNVELRVREIAA